MTASRGDPSAAREEGRSPGVDYRVVSAVTRHGERITIPDDARNVSVQQLGRGGAVRVTYLTPVYEVPFGDGRRPDDRADREYVY